MMQLTQITFGDLVSKTKIALRRKSPFFSYLIEYLKIYEDKNVPTAGINKTGKMLVNPDFINGLAQDNQTRALYFEGIFIHEVMHLAMKHLDRALYRNYKVHGKNRSFELWNVACDIVINNIVLQNGFQLPEGALIPSNNSITLFNGTVVINDISEKSAEDVYEELRRGIEEGIENGSIKEGEGDGEGTPGDISIDQDSPEGSDHSRWGEDDGEGDEEGEGTPKSGKGNKSGKGKAKGKMPDASDLEKIDWDDVMAKAHTFAKQQGNLPAGIEVEYHTIHKARIKWNGILKKEVAKSIPFDLSYAKPNKHYLWMNDIYMPSTTGESVSILAAIDTSGSISQKELSDFISELVGIARAYRGQVEFRILTHDVEVHDDIFISNQKGAKAVQNIKLHGGGGTSHIPLYEYIEMKGYAKKTKLLISFTDGYSSFPENTKVKSIFVLGGYHCGKGNMPKWSNKVLELEPPR